MPTVSLMLVCLAIQETDAAVSSLVERQQSTLGLMWAVEMDIDVTFDVAYAEPQRPPLHMWHYHWARDPRRERQHYRQLHGELTRKGQPINLGDLLDDANDRRMVLNWDYSKPPSPLTPGATTVQAHLLPRTRKSPRVFFPDPLARVLLQAIQAENFDVVRSVPDFFRESPRVSLGVVDDDGRQEVIAQHPDDRTGGDCKGCLLRIFFDPAHGGLIGKVVVEAPANRAASAPMLIESEVLRWSTPAPGVFVPLETRNKVVAPLFEGGKDKLMADARMVVTNVRLNEDVPDSAFDMPFPEGVIVHDYRDASKPLYHLWGTGDRALATASDISALPVPGFQSTDIRGIWRPWMLPALCACLAVALIGVWYCRRRSP